MLKNKIISAFLALVMIFALIPTQVFADISVNMDTTTTPAKKGSYSEDWMRVSPVSGWRVSVWYADSNGKDSSGNAIYNWEEAFQIGNNLNIKAEGMNGQNPAVWGTSNIFDYVNKGGNKLTWNFDQFQPGVKGFTVGIWSNDMYIEPMDKDSSQARLDSIEKKYWDEWQLILDKLDKGSNEYNKLKDILDCKIHLKNEVNTRAPIYSTYDGTTTDVKTLKGYFTHPFILNNISYESTKGTDYKSWMPTDFIYGRYDKDGDKYYEHQGGSYKIYIEPLYFAVYDGVYTCMTWQEMMAIDKNQREYSLNPLGVFAARNRALHVANGGSLTEIDTSLKFSDGSYMGSLLSSGKKTFSGSESIEDIRNSYWGDKFAGNYLGVTVLTSPSVSVVEGPQIVKTYVTIDSVDADGTVHYKKAKDSVIEKANFYLNEKGDLTNIAQVFPSEYIPEGKAVLNDIITVENKVKVDEKAGWVDTDLPTGIMLSNVELKPTADDIPTYAFGLVTDSKVAIEAITNFDVAMGEDETSALLDFVADTATKSMDFSASGVSTTELQTSIYSLSGGKGRASSITVVETTKLAKELETYADIQVGKAVNDFVEVIRPEETDKKITPSNHIILRYIVVPDPVQIDIIEIVDEEKGTTTFVSNEPRPLDKTDTDVTIQKPEFEAPEGATGPNIIEWVTNPELPFKDISTGTLPPSIDTGKNGKTEDKITEYPDDPIVHNLYVKWKVIISKKTEDLKDSVPQWRLSKYRGTLLNEVSAQNASMFLNLTADNTFHVSSTLNPSENYNFITLNPNGQKTTGDTPENMRMNTISTDYLSSYNTVSANSWFHSKAIPKSTALVTHSKPYAYIKMDGTLNMIKSTDSASLITAKWLTPDGTATELNKYSVETGVLPKSYSNGLTYNKLADLRYGIYNKDIYEHQIARHYHFFGCRCYTTPEYFGVSSAKYGTANYGLNVSFDRYIQQNTDTKKLQVKPEVKSENGKTTLKFQVPNKDIKVYPEYGMLFANDNPTDTNHETIKWVVGDQARLINPVVYQTLEHKVYVVPTSTGIGATDSRAITNARKIGEANKQVFYKGSAVTTAFKLQRGENDTNKGILTVKTFALDIDNSTLKSAWGNTGYNSLEQHTLLTNKVANTNVTGTEKLLIDSPNPNYGGLDYTGAEKSKTDLKYEPITYGTSTITTFTHELVVRGGTLIGVNVQPRDKENKKENKVFYTMNELKSADSILYEAIINMSLYNESNDRNNTIFSTFEHQTGDILTENSYADKLDAIRKIGNSGKATPDVSKIVENKGWYSEDTTVLVIKEYVTNYTVPHTSFSDKISMSVKGLESPTNKNQFFSELGKGYTYLKYNLPLNKLYSNILLPDINAYFEYTGFPSDDKGMGKQETSYLVPNASVSDSTSLS